MIIYFKDDRGKILPHLAFSVLHKVKMWLVQGKLQKNNSNTIYVEV